MATELGTRIRKARHVARLTPEQMAMELGVSVGTLFRYERKDAAKLSVGRLLRIADVTKRPISFFFDDEEDAA